MADHLFSWLAALGIIAVLSYWHIAEKTTSHADPDQSGHSQLWRRLIRALLPAAGALLILQLMGLVSVPMPVPDQIRFLLVIFGHVVFWPSVALAVWARREIGSNWAHAADYQVVEGQLLVVSGPYKYARHPIYSAMFAVFVGVELIVVSWLVVLAIPLAWFLVSQSRKEEKLLRAAFGDTYGEYVHQTGMFIPRII
jgi:protein-S-isoprenylcysteine O-methyltransferase Ste14